MPLGRGLSSLIPSSNYSPSSKESENDFELLSVSPDLIDPNPYQPRDTFPHGTLEELIESIKEHGILEPLLVTKKTNGRYELISGERRLKAAKILQLKTVPVIVRKAEDLEKLELALIENLQREDLNPIEEAEGYRQLIDTFNLTQETIAKKIGKSREAIANALRLLNLPGEIQAAIANRKITPSHGRILLQITDPKKQKEVFQKMLLEQWSVKEAEIRSSALKRKKIPPSRDFKTLAQEEKLREFLETKVKIEKQKNKGKIIIEFYSEEELENLINKILS